MANVPSGGTFTVPDQVKRKLPVGGLGVLAAVLVGLWALREVFG